MELKVQTYIKNSKNWKKNLRKEPYCIEIKEDDNYYLLKYRMMDKPDFSNPIVQECRGLILRKDNLKAVCVPFFKFGNYGESYVPKIDWGSVRIQEKIDGSLIKVWYDDDKWRISTNGMIDAFTAELGTSTKYSTFGELFMNACELQKLDFSSLNKDYTYMFELVSPYNLQVVPYDEIKIYHIGTRNNITLEELNINIGIAKPYEYLIEKDLDKVIEMANRFKLDKEGFVIVDQNWNRIKIKSEAYVQAHYLNNGNSVSDKKILEIVLKGEVEEFLNYLPKYSDRVNHIQGKLQELFYDMDKEYKEMKSKLAKYVNNETIHKSYLLSTITNSEPIKFITSLSIQDAYDYLYDNKRSGNE